MNNLYITGQPGRTAYVKGKEYLFFSGYAYLGMSHVPEFIELIKEGIDKYGLLYPSSRISNTRLSLYEEMEAMLSSITGMEETVLVSSGFTAGRMAVKIWNSKVINLPHAHPAIQADDHTETIATQQHVIATDAVNPLTATITDFSFLAPHKTEACIVDDSHGFGLLGSNGEGIASALPSFGGEYVLTYSLSKAANLIGGAIGCSHVIAEQLRNLPEYTAGTSIAPAYLHAFIHGQHLYKQQREKLKANIQYLQSLLGTMPDIKTHSQLPIVILSSDTDEQELLSNNIIISSFAYPDPQGKKTQRVVVNALHHKEDLERLAAAIGM